MAAAASEPPMVEQVITEFFAKSLHIILESRSPYESSRSFTRPSPPSSPLSGSQPRDRWFNLALRDCPAALENFDLWRQSNLEPLVIDIVMLHRDSSNSSTAEGGKIIERWVIQYETSKSGIGSSHGSKNRKSRNSSSEDHSLYRSAYKGSTLLFRSLHLLVRLLPAYNLFRDLNSSGRIRPLNLSHKISSFVEPFTRAEDAGMKHYAFAPIETLFGHLSLSVTYVPVLEVVAAPEPTRPMPTELIPDYVGSPTTDFLRQFSSLPSDGIAPACAAMTRRHSWSIDHAARSSGSPSPSSMNSEPRGRLQPRVLMHDNPQTARPHPNSTLSPGKKKGTGFEECYPSPPLSPSPSRSPSASYPKNPLFRFESAPVVIPTVRDGGGGSALPPSPSLKGKHQLPCQSYNLTPSPDGNSNVRKDLVRFGEYDNKKNLQKVLSSGIDDLGYFHGLKFTRTSSKLFITDELDERELAFVWEDRDTIIDQLNRAGISDSGGQGTNQDTGGSMTRTPAAAICALVGMLKTAQGLGESRPSIAAPPPPVPQESSSVQRVMTEERGDTNAAPSSALRRARTAADALEELKKYKEIKESILGHAKASPRDPMEGQKPADRDP